jgi:hypothetical protein
MKLILLSTAIFTLSSFAFAPQSARADYTYVVCDGPPGDPCMYIRDFDQANVVVCGPVYDPCGVFNSTGQYVGKSSGVSALTSGCGTIDNPCSSKGGTLAPINNSSVAYSGSASTPASPLVSPVSAPNVNSPVQTCAQTPYPRVYSTTDSSPIEKSNSVQNRVRQSAPYVLVGMMATAMYGYSTKKRKDESEQGEEKKSP